MFSPLKGEYIAAEKVLRQCFDTGKIYSSSYVFAQVNIAIIIIYIYLQSKY